MDWLEVAVRTNSFGIEPVCGLLYNMGITGLQIEDAQDFKTFIESNKSMWDYVDDELLKLEEIETAIKFYVTDNPSGNEMLSAVLSAVRSLDNPDQMYGELDVIINSRKEEDWANNWKKYYKPFEIGKRLFVKPEWEDITPAKEKIVLNINPGSLFGTGMHETTQLCMIQLEKRVKEKDVVLDLGCGSGILSIVSLLLGAAHATAVDIDPNAIETAYANGHINGIGKDKYLVLSGNVLEDKKLQDSFGDEKYDIVVANIIADVIIDMSPMALNKLKKGGYFITSGIIADRMEDVLNQFKKLALQVDEIETKGEWVCITAKNQGV